MERTETAVALIDLGAASVETQGVAGLDFELVGMQRVTGLSDED
ncbi:benenodin family lasso peptide [Sphingomonas sp. PB4P5]